MKAFWAALTLFGCVTLATVAVSACSCADPSQRERFRSSDSVFAGEVTQFGYLSEEEGKLIAQSDPKEYLKLFFYKVTFKVEKQWKGLRQKEITALAGFDLPGMCGDLDLSAGRRILVYAPRLHNRLLIYRDCGPNRYAENSEKEIGRMGNLFFRFKTFFFPYPKF